MQVISRQIGCSKLQSKSIWAEQPTVHIGGVNRVRVCNQHDIHVLVVGVAERWEFGSITPRKMPNSAPKSALSATLVQTAVNQKESFDKLFIEEKKPEGSEFSGGHYVALWCQLMT